jgi:hypothetical protein
MSPEMKLTFWNPTTNDDITMLPEVIARETRKGNLSGNKPDCPWELKEA